MRPKSFLITAACVSFISSVAIVLWPTQKIPIDMTQETYFAKKILAGYVAAKGSVVTASRNLSFAALLTNQPAVLGVVQTDQTSAALNNPPLQGNYVIALLGDSMTYTLGPTLPHLSKILKSKYPHATFTLLNYGMGASDLESGLARLTNATTIDGEIKPPLLSLNPHVVVVESFAYNHWENTQADLDRQWLTLAKIAETIKSKNPDTKIIFATTITPDCPTYTDGSANLPPERKWRQCETVKAYLSNLINFATSFRYPLADAYSASLSGLQGNPKYINQADHIHPSEAGMQLFSQKVSEAISPLLSKAN